MTPKERAAARKAEKQAEARRFPSAHLIHRQYGTSTAEGAVKISLEQGEPGWLTVGQRGEWPDQPISLQGWRHMHIALTDIAELGCFIHALVCRYNALVHEANARAAQSAMKPLKTIPE